MNFYYSRAIIQCLDTYIQELTKKPKLRSDGTATALSQRTEQLIILSKEKIWNWTMKQTMGFAFGHKRLGYTSDLQRSCATVDSGICLQACLMIARDMTLSFDYGLHAALRVWDDDDMDHGFCEACREDAKEQHETGRKQLWNKLPDMFGLESWADLKASELL